MFSFILRILNFIINYIYSPYLVGILLFSGLWVFLIDTEHAYLFGNNKDYIISFFWGLFNITIGVLLIILSIIHSTFVI